MNEFTKFITEQDFDTIQEERAAKIAWDRVIYLCVEEFEFYKSFEDIKKELEDFESYIQTLHSEGARDV